MSSNFQELGPAGPPQGAMDPGGGSQPLTSQAQPQEMGPIPLGPAQAEQGFIPMTKAFLDEFHPIEGIKSLAALMQRPTTGKPYGGLVDAVMRSIKAGELVKEQADTDWKNGDYLHAAARYIFSVTPLLGSWENERLGEADRGEWSQLAGHVAGMATTFALPELLGGIAKGAKVTMGNMADAGLARSLGGTASMSEDVLANSIQAMKEHNIAVGPEAMTKLNTAMTDVRAAQDTLVSHPGAPTIRADAILIPAQQRAQGIAASKFLDATDLDAIDKSTSEFMNKYYTKGTPGTPPTPKDIPAVDVLHAKRAEGAVIKSYEEAGKAVDEVRKGLVYQSKTALNSLFPDMAGLTADDQRMIDLEAPLQRSVDRMGNLHILGVETPLAAIASGVSTGIATGSPAAGALVGGIAGGTTSLMKWLLTDPAIQSKLALSLYRGSRGATTLPQAFGKVLAAADAVGSAVTAQKQQAAAQP